MNSTDEDDDFDDGNYDGLQRRRRRRRRIFKPRINFDLPMTYKMERFRLTDAHIDVIIDRLAPFIRHETDRNFALSPEEQIRLSLRFLAMGDYQRSIGDSHGVHKSTVSRALHRFVTILNREFYNEFVDWPTTLQQARGIVEKFSEKGIQGVFGCIDGTHVELVNLPKEVEAQYVSRYGHTKHTINAMVVCGPNLR